MSIDAVSQALITARQAGTPAAAAVLAGVDEAYAVQAAVARALGWFARGPARHWKSGGRSLQAPLTHAPLPPAGVCTSPADLRALPLQLRGIEAEVALRLGAPVDAALAATLDAAAAAALVDAMCVAIEVVDSRWAEGLQAPAWAKLADLQSHGALVLGDWLPCAPRDWAAQACTVHIGRQPAQAFIGSHSLGDPAAVLAPWLRHATRDGTVLPAGTVVTTGTWCGLLMAQPGDEVQVRFDGLGAVTVRL